MLTIEQMNLSPRAEAGARALLAKHPAAQFTSGRRDIDGQASAMASNVIRNRRWIAATYRSTPASRTLQDWVDDHPEARTQAQIAAGLAVIMHTWAPDELAELTRHLSGDAFDLQPMAGPEGLAVLATARALPFVDEVLTHEGGLVRWHVQFHPVPALH